MRISFCDLCNESIPLTDFELGKAQRRKGRAICARCEAAMHGSDDAEPAAGRDGPHAPGLSPSAPGSSPGSRSSAADPKGTSGSTASAGPILTVPVAAPARGSSLGTVLAVVALIFACGAAVFLLERIEALRADQAGMRAGLGSDLDLLERRLQARFEAGGEPALATAERADALALRLMTRVDLLEYEKDTLQEELATLRGALQELRDLQEARSSSSLPASSASSPASSLGAGATPDTGTSTSTASPAVSGGADETVSGTSGTDGGGAGGDKERLELPEPVVTKTEAPAWWSHVRDLSDSNSGRRWGAVQALGKTGDPAVIEHVVPALKDSDLFVRLAAARVLGDLRAMIAVGHLIDALEDKAPSVREQAAVSLRAITGENHRFVHDAPSRERAKRIKDWREWWNRHKARLLGVDSGS